MFHTFRLNWDGRPSAIMKSSDGLSGGLAAKISRGGKQVEFQPCAEYLAKVQPGCASDPQIILSALASEDGNTLTANIYVWMWSPRESPITLTRETPSGVVSPQPARAPATPGAPPPAPPRISTRLDDDKERFDALMGRYSRAFDALVAARSQRGRTTWTTEEQVAMGRLDMVRRTIRSAIAAGDTASIEKELAAGEDAVAVLEKGLRPNAALQASPSAVSPQPVQAPAAPAYGRERYRALLDRYYTYQRQRGRALTAQERDRLNTLIRTIPAALAAGDTDRIDKGLAAAEDALAMLEKDLR